MDADELDRVLERYGRRSWRGHGGRPDERGERVLRLDPPALLWRSDRGDQVERTFGTAGEACRHWLALELTDRPLPAGPAAPRGRPDAGRVPAAHPGGWRLALPPLTGVAARGEGLVVLRDGSSLLAHGADGAPFVTALDARTGRERWSVPVTGLLVRPELWVLGEHVLLVTPAELRCLRAADGAERWRAAVPWAPTRGRPAVLAHDGDRALLTASAWQPRSRRAASASVDLRTGATCWELGFTLAEVPAGAPPRIDRLLVAAVRSGELGVFASGLRDRDMALLTRTAAPAGFDAGRLVVTADLLGGRDGYAVVRATTGDGGSRGDAVVAAGRAEPAFASPALAPVFRDVTVTALDARRFLLHDGVADTTQLRWLDGRTGWTRPGEHRRAAAAGAGTVAQLGHGAAGTATVLVRDDGTEAWRRPGILLGLVRDGVLVLGPGGDLARCDAATGEVRRSAALPEGVEQLGFPRGHDAGDGMVVVERDDALTAVAA